MTGPFINIRGAKSDDAMAILDIDIKCFETAWGSEEWGRIGHSTECAISVATNFGTPIAVAAFRFSPAESGVEILKLAVKPAYRRQNISLQLIMAGVDYAVQRNANHLFIIVPESTVYPGPINTSQWLNAVGFDVSKQQPFVKQHFKSYGEHEDGVKFVAPVIRRPS